MKAILYIRVSSLEQAQGGISLQAQEAKLRAYSDLYDLEVVKVVSDAGVSAKSLKRPGLQEALALLESGEAAALVVVKLDRLTRSIADWTCLIETYFAKRFALLSVNDQIDTRSASGRMVLNVLISIGQWEREAAGERTSAALQHLKSKGIHIGSVPFGYQRLEGKLVKVDELADTLDLIHTMRQSGATLQRIADELNQRAIPTARGGRWHPATVKNVLARAS